MQGGGTSSSFCGASHTQAACGVCPAPASLVARGLGEKVCMVWARCHCLIVFLQPEAGACKAGGKRQPDLVAGSRMQVAEGVEPSVAFCGTQYPGMARVRHGTSCFLSSPPSPLQGRQRPAAGGGRRHSQMLKGSGESSLPWLSPGPVNLTQGNRLERVAGGTSHSPTFN